MFGSFLGTDASPRTRQIRAYRAAFDSCVAPDVFVLPKVFSAFSADFLIVLCVWFFGHDGNELDFPSGKQ